MLERKWKYLDQTVDNRENPLKLTLIAKRTQKIFSLFFDKVLKVYII